MQSEAEKAESCKETRGIPNNAEISRQPFVKFTTDIQGSLEDKFELFGNPVNIHLVWSESTI